MNPANNRRDSSRFSHFNHDLYDDDVARKNSSRNSNTTAMTAGLVFPSSEAPDDGQPLDSIGAFVTVTIPKTKRPFKARKFVTSRSSNTTPLRYEAASRGGREPRVGKVAFRNAAATTSHDRRSAPYAIPNPRNSLPLDATSSSSSSSSSSSTSSSASSSSSSSPPPLLLLLGKH
ncbi:hypothetical protein BsWGS_08841 [Bradybaena similaris]